MEYSFTTLSMCFFVYAFIGWLYESSIWAPLEKKEFLNRGFLIGPFCPIYGLVAILDYYALSWLKQPVLIFFTAIILCCCIEYLVSFTFEKAFKTRWWDYSNYPFNINGRISLYSGLLFGVLGLFLVKVLHPWLYSSFNKIPSETRNIIILIMAILIFSDTIVSILAHTKVSNHITKEYNKVVSITDLPFVGLNKIKKVEDNKAVGLGLKKILQSVEKMNDRIILTQRIWIKKAEPKNPNRKIAYLNFIKNFRAYTSEEMKTFDTN